MSETIHGTANEAWLALLKFAVMGDKQVVKGKETTENLGSSIAFNMRRPLVNNKVRDMSLAFAFAEASWILMGSNKTEFIKQYAPSYSRFSDDGIFQAGGYGPKFIDQLPYILKNLCDDQTSRQAVMTLWRDRPYSSLDIACTISIQWLIRRYKLHCVVNMRSSDTWLGVPYDWFTFTCMSSYVLQLLGTIDPEMLELDLGNLHFNAASQHVYAKHYDKAWNALEQPHEYAWETTDMDVWSWEHPDNFALALAVGAEYWKNTPSFSVSCVDLSYSAEPLFKAAEIHKQ